MTMIGETLMAEPRHSVRQYDFERGEILNIDKPAGWTSFDVVKKIRNTVKVKKVGHAGTLDPFATGVLLVCTGKATKQVSRLMGMEKEYVAELELGKESDTYDPTGVITENGELRDIARDEIDAVCASFTGEIQQVPPMYSAIKVEGQRLYKLARQGIVIEREARSVHIHSIDVLLYEAPLLRIKVVCSKGTYIRSLAHDIGRVLGCGAYLTKLTRTRVGEYTLEDAHTIPEFVGLHVAE